MNVDRWGRVGGVSGTRVARWGAAATPHTDTPVAVRYAWAFNPLCVWRMVRECRCGQIGGSDGTGVNVFTKMILFTVA